MISGNDKNWLPRTRTPVKTKEAINNYKLIADSTGSKAIFKNTSSNNKNLAVFVHGFTGDYLNSWGLMPQLLTQDQRLSNFDFLFWGYSSNLFAPKDKFITENIKQLFIQVLNKHKTNQPIEIIAKGLQTELNYLKEYENITLIGHSMGGLVIRSYIIQNLKEHKHQNLERINKINQIILFGTPNEGLDVANNKILGGLNNQIYDMGTYNEFINSLREEWVEQVFKNKDLKFSTLMVAGEEDYFVPFTQVSKYFRDCIELTKGDHVSMIKPHSVNDVSYRIISENLLKINEANNPNDKNIQEATQTYPSKEYINILLEKITKLIADRGLDDEDWAYAVSSQYFLISLARLLDITETSDYQNLLDLFLKSFYMRVDNSIILSEDKMLITPEETKRMMKFMIDEDQKDDYFSRFNKNRAVNIDLKLMHDNYHYGLITQISRPKEFPESLTLKLINKLAIDRLLYGKDNKKAIDDHGGWNPQRVPFLTARILISLKNSGYVERSDKEYIEENAAKAIAYLIRCIYQNKYWRSGISKWVSDFEATALCLEAIDQWDKIIDNKVKINSIIKYLFSIEEEWMTYPSFDSEEASNKTLAAVTLLCNILIINHKYFNDEFNIDYTKYLDYLSNVFDIMTKTSTPVVRQYNTVPQITYYITRLILTLDHSKAS